MNTFRSSWYIITILFLSVSSTSQSSLYSEDDPLSQLNSDNFGKYVYGKSNAWIIQFYNSWCGHCIRFSPVWKQLARNTQNWKTVIDVAVVNCNDKENVPLCRQYNIQVFPTIKLFWHHVNGTEPGHLFTSSRDISSMESGMISFLDSHWNEGIPHRWPNLLPIEETSMANLLETIPKDKQSIMIFVEHPDSFVGRKIILDLASQKNHFVKRLLSSNELLDDLKSIQSNETIPALIEINRNSHDELLMRFPKEDNDTYIRDKVFERIVGEPRIKSQIDEVTESPPTKPSVTNNVYMTDLENALYYSLSQEVGVNKYIQGEKISALKAFLFALKTYFPGSTPVMGYLSDLHNWVSYKKHSITGEEFVQAMEKMQGKEKYLPKMREWVGCKGSKSKYRGYPCSLWTLFHTLTVQADLDGTEGTGEVLFIIKDYIKNFFTCDECVKNFLQMAANVEKDVKSSDAAVLWLWRAHNKANRRLAGDITEDPKHPKIQFPLANECPKCRTKGEKSNEDGWDESQVLMYLHQFYGKSNILNKSENQDSPPVNENMSYGNSGMGINISNPILLLFFNGLIYIWG